MQFSLKSSYSIIANLIGSDTSTLLRRATRLHSIRYNSIRHNLEMYVRVCNTYSSQLKSHFASLLPAIGSFHSQFAAQNVAKTWKMRRLEDVAAAARSFALDLPPYNAKLLMPRHQNGAEG